MMMIVIAIISTLCTLVGFLPATLASNSEIEPVARTLLTGIVVANAVVAALAWSSL